MELKYTCDICKKQSCSEKDAKQHLLLAHTKWNGSYVCSLCGIMNQMKDDILRHFFDVHNVTPPFRCEYCDKNFKYKSSLRIHMKQHVLNGLKHECKECDRKYAFPHTLAAHVDACHKGIRYTCDICRKAFTTKQSLSFHELKHRPDYVPPLLSCASCDKNFATSNGLRKHVEIVHKKNVFVCSICGKVLASKCSLDDHMTVHQEIKMHSCDVCGKLFSRKGGLREHMVVHTKERRHKCDECGVTFTNRTPLVIHIRKVHKNETPYECTVCHRRFVVKAQMNHHMKRVHVKKPSGI